jgi:hypothetical protein
VLAPITPTLWAWVRIGLTGGQRFDGGRHGHIPQA